MQSLRSLRSETSFSPRSVAPSRQQIAPLRSCMSPKSVPNSAVREFMVESATLAMVKDFAEVLMSAAADAVCGVAYGERSPERVSRRDGYRERDWETRVGSAPRLQQPVGEAETNACSARGGSRSWCSSSASSGCRRARSRGWRRASTRSSRTSAPARSRACGSQLIGSPPRIEYLGPPGGSRRAQAARRARRHPRRRRLRSDRRGGRARARAGASIRAGRAGVAVGRRRAPARAARRAGLGRARRPRAAAVPASRARPRAGSRRPRARASTPNRHAPRRAPARAPADRAGTQLGRRSWTDGGVSACAHDSLERCAEWWPGRVERAREQRGRLFARERAQLDAGRAQQLLRLTGAPRQVELRILFLARASTKCSRSLIRARLVEGTAGSASKRAPWRRVRSRSS